ncbi:helix-turn-helix domain-containing protein [Lawsonibacter celer]|jgi:transcriptional regulator with XRE-family HTH domain|uniref:helix-turn-helix domain-containing protein n=1 Tax=Lawsonibacter celer TaxID=2986526 RepID=UPI0016448C06|nr:helix-turn-helix transcriptional regulator [Lawsonibacter celer]
MEFTEKLFMLRQEKGISQKAVAEAIGITLRQYHRFERGDQKPGFDNLRKIADFFDVSADFLLGRTDRRSGAGV